MNQYSVGNHYQGRKGIEFSQGRQDELNHLGYQLQKKLFMPYLSSADVVLDFGCGNGSLSMAISSSVKLVEGLEVNEYPRNLAVEQGLHVYSSIGNIPTDKHYNVIITNHVLEHIPDVIGTLKHLSQLLEDDGTLIVVVPIEDFRSKRNRRWNPTDPDHHLHTWTPLLFGNMLSEAGLEPLDLKIITKAWSPKLFFLGDTWVQSVANTLLSIFKRRRQLLAVAGNPRKNLS